jgi:ubiquinone/menaquinone biosynthesis C-methylase UbiE
MAAVDIHRLFDRVAHLYDTGWLQRTLYVAVQDRALDELQRRQPGSVLDVGCGTGIFADRIQRELTPAAVAGCDLSAGMLAEAATRSRRVAWVQADSARLPVRGGVVDAVVCTQAFHFFDQKAAWAEFRRVLTPGGLALVGMINPESPKASRWLTKISTGAAKTRVTWATRAALRRTATEVGFEVIAQHEVSWKLSRLAPLVLTVARAPNQDS